MHGIPGVAKGRHPGGRPAATERGLKVIAARHQGLEYSSIAELFGYRNAEQARKAFYKYRFKLDVPGQPDPLITPAEVIAAGWVKRHPRGVQRVTARALGDPMHERSAAGGWTPQGWAVDPAGWESQRWPCRLPRARTQPSKPELLRDESPFVRYRARSDSADRAGAAQAVEDVRGCLWPIGDPKDSDFHFCNSKRRVGSSYCQRHAAVCTWRAHK